MKANLAKVGEIYNNRCVIEEVEPKRYGKKKYLARRWLIKCCNCGTQITAINTDIRRSGCQVCRNLAKGETGFNVLYQSYQSAAKIKKLDFLLDKEVFRSLTQLPCHYCGVSPSAIKFADHTSTAFWTDFVYNGIDRIDNSKGYTVENCVPCCGFCNHAKSDKPYETFITYLNRIASFRRNDAS